MVRGILLAGFAVLLFGCTPKSDVVVGGIYSIDNGNGTFGIVHVLDFDNDDTILVKDYDRHWPTRPTMADTPPLHKGSAWGDEDGYEMPPSGTRMEAFWDWKPILIGQQKVSDLEFDGHKDWKTDRAYHS